MMTKINYQPWLQAVLTVAKHYRIEPSEERVRLQLDWNQNQNLDEILLLMTRQVGLNLRKVKFSNDVVNPWRLPVIVELNDGQVGVIDKADTEGNVSIQLSGDQGLSQKFAVGALKHIVKSIYVLRPEKSVPDARIDEYIKPYEKLVLVDRIARLETLYRYYVCFADGKYFGFSDNYFFHASV